MEAQLWSSTTHTQAPWEGRGGGGGAGQHLRPSSGSIHSLREGLGTSEAKKAGD